MITLTNEFHGTSYTLRRAGHISDRTARRIHSALCPSHLSGCTCGGNLGQRGRQNPSIDAYPVYAGGKSAGWQVTVVD